MVLWVRCCWLPARPGHQAGSQHSSIPIFLPQPAGRGGFQLLWVSVLSVWLSDKGEGSQTSPLNTGGLSQDSEQNPENLTVLPSSSLVTGLGHVGKK